MIIIGFQMIELFMGIVFCGQKAVYIFAVLGFV
jgi:hypothetical protein